MKTIHIPVEGTNQYFMVKQRGYISIRNKRLHFYHKFHSMKKYKKWLATETITLAWGDSISQIIKEL